MKSNKFVRIGCIADDFTGASDIGSFFVKGGMTTLLTNGIPTDTADLDLSVEAIVVALKIRSIPADQAVDQALKALTYLQKAGCEYFYFKYCSTFDSTPKGNIGPVTDALINALKVPYTLLCPSLPVNGRTVTAGCLYVFGVPLHESPMKEHPVNPMWDYSLAKLMEPQARYTSITLSAEELMETEESVQGKITAYSRAVQGAPFYIIPDYVDELQGERIAQLFKELPLITGGSGLAVHLAKAHKKSKLSPEACEESFSSGTDGRAVIFAGSCSKATKEQIQVFKKSQGNTLVNTQGNTLKNTLRNTQSIALELSAEKLTAEKLSAGMEYKRYLKQYLSNPETGDLLIHTPGNGDAGELTSQLELSQQEISEIFETAMADCAEAALQSGVTRIIVAGGETAGAITERLGFSSFLLGVSVAPGVPVLIPVQNRSLRIVLKSGNFGQPDFFFRALKVTGSLQ